MGRKLKIAFASSNFVVGFVLGLIFAAAAGSFIALSAGSITPETHEFCIDQSGNIRFPGSSLDRNSGSECKASESLIQIAAEDQINGLSGLINSLARRVDTLPMQAHTPTTTPSLPASYQAVSNIIGSTGIILPLVADTGANSFGSSFTTSGDQAFEFTWSEPVSDFDATPSIMVDLPVVTFNGTDEEADTPDAAYWSRTLAPMSVGAWVNLTDATLSFVLAKYDSSSNTREWIFGTSSSDKLLFDLYDEGDAVSPNANINTIAGTALSQGVWVFVVATYDGSADASGINLYQDGVLVASTDDDDANFTSMRDTTANVMLAHHKNTPESLFDGKLQGGPLGPFFTHTELSASEVTALYELGKAAFGLP